jgi:myo-inositol 2-dehydrogenase / D-chiro-inositol 1-dehydrogenase
MKKISGRKNSTPGRKGLDRRQFLSGVGGAAMSFSIMNAGLARGSAANSKISLGLIGCGSRGTWLADLFKKHGGYEVTAAHDYFPERVSAFGDKFKVPAARRFSGLKGYQRLLDAKVDAVAIESPPYFHHEQAAAAVDSGTHVYLAKPIAVDVPGCRSIESSAKKAEAKKLAFLIDFQTRTDPFYQEAIRRVQKDNGIGRIICGEASYVAGSPWTGVVPQLQENPQDPERRLRAWGVSKALSGDIITEQNIHALDVMTWVLDQHPAKALGTGGLKSRTAGDVWDHFSVIFWFPDDVLVTFYSKQYGEGADDIRCQMFGTEGALDTHYEGDVFIKGKNPFPGGRDPSLYTTGAVRNIATFYDQVSCGRFDYSTVPASVRSNLTTILGRTAAYKLAEYSWDELMRSEEVLDPHLEGLKE